MILRNMRTWLYELGLQFFLSYAASHTYVTTLVFETLEFQVLLSLARDYIQNSIPIEILSVERDVPAMRLAL